MNRCAPSSIFCVRKRLQLPTTPISDKTSSDQVAPIGEMDEAENVMRRGQLQKGLKCMQSSPIGRNQRCILQYYD